MSLAILLVHGCLLFTLAAVITYLAGTVRDGVMFPLFLLALVLFMASTVLFSAAFMVGVVL